MVNRTYSIVWSIERIQYCGLAADGIRQVEQQDIPTLALVADAQADQRYTSTGILAGRHVAAWCQGRGGKTG